ncbi:MAG TPA: PhzF family phenazine biosynthesis protein [Spirochaetota bacterium]|nr:PhzF family phenazine biosynthesis protein [Spirochaetota bacterium]HPC42365.1 PhzF family phenazine biosynthesis protein [Spirochaetota bacterium]HPL16417.1 PhzF family phenazine biosynthesis protein [Spirochaetota bacterium]HQJ69778.1 PhzF family phenazine biosynthesis protein [Spirochaetota bacterium]HRS76434.1 PhzF family phenazine biosynthesis protein [Spirochaetota bacterium]
MKKFKFKKIDAFASGSSTGNPAGCVYLDGTGDITEGEMQSIAAQLKGFVNEVVYIFPEDGGFFLRYFSSEREVEFCGHGTIAAMYDLVAGDGNLRSQNNLSIRVRDERLDVVNDIDGGDAVYITAPLPLIKDTMIGAKTVSAALEIDASAIDTRQPITIVNAGLNTLIVPIHTLDDCLKMHPDLEDLMVFCQDHGIDIILVFSAETASGQRRYRTRVFAPRYGYLEDPATGSGNSAFACYLLHIGAWDGEALAIEQNGDRSNPNIIRLRTVMKDGTRRVQFGGGAVVRIDGEYILY